MSTPAPPGLPLLAEPPGCCIPPCDCAALLAAPKGAAAYEFNTYAFDCSPTVEAGNFPFIVASGCAGLLDFSPGVCGDSPFGCGANSSIIAGATYQQIFQYSGGADPYLIFLAIKPDLTADLFARFPAVYSGGVCTTCPDAFGDIWAAYNVAITYDVNCQAFVPLTAMARIVSCGNQGAPSLRVGII